MATSKVAADIARRTAEGDDARESIAAAIDAEDVCLRAEVAAGRWLREMAKHQERERRGGDRTKLQRATLLDLGVTKTESKRWQDIEEVPEDLRERYVESIKRTR